MTRLSEGFHHTIGGQKENIMLIWCRVSTQFITLHGHGTGNKGDNSSDKKGSIYITDIYHVHLTEKLLSGKYREIRT